jgi:hypothetical protein
LADENFKKERKYQRKKENREISLKEISKPCRKSAVCCRYRGSRRRERGTVNSDVSRIEFTITGQLYSLKNNRMILPVAPKNPVAAGAKCPHCKKPLMMMTHLNSKASAFERAFRKQLPESAKQNWEMPVGVTVTIYYPTNLQDADEAHVFDLMQAYGVIKNDRQVVSKFVRKLIDPDNPRVHVVVIPVLWDRSGRQPGLFHDDTQQNPMEVSA